MLALKQAPFIKAVVNNGELMTNQKLKYGYALLLLFISFAAHASESRMDSADLFDSILKLFHNTAHTWSHTLINYASWLFWTLALISMVWTYGLMALQKADLQEFFRETIKFIVTLGFFYWLLLNGPAIASSIIDSLRQLAANASGFNKQVSPSTIVDVGFDIVSKAIDNSSIWSPSATTVGLIVAGLILIILTMVGMNLLIILISGWVMTYAGIFLLGFGGGRWTQEIAINYYRSILGIALQAFAMVLVIGIGKSFIDQYYALMSKDILLKEMFIMLAVACVLLTLIDKIPPLLSGLVQGGGGFGGGGPSGGIGLSGALGAMGIAGAGLSAGVGVAAGSGAGGMAALSAAFKAAGQSMDSASSLSSLTGVSSSSKLGGLAAAMGQAGKFAGSFGAHLTSGSIDVAREKASSIKNAVSDRVSETTGGKIASKISSKLNDVNSASSESSAGSATPQASGNVEPLATTSGEFSSGSNNTANSDVGSIDFNHTKGA
jgi:type IV secretion system protein TrbL